MHVHTTVWLLAFGCSFPATVHAQATFTGLGAFGGTESSGHDVSADGTVVVGTVTGLPGNANGIFRWTSAASAVHTETARSTLAVSGDGLTVVGSRFLPTSNLDEAFRWIPDDGIFEGLGDFPGGQLNSTARDVSADGSVIVGLGDANGSTTAFRWTEGTGLTPIAGMQVAHSVTPDGEVIVGRGSSPNPLRWTAQTGIVELDTLPGALSAHPTAISADGNTVVGANHFRVGIGFTRAEASRWTGQDVVESLESLPWIDTVAEDVSADGSAVVGIGQLSGATAFYWSPQSGMVEVQALLASLGVTNLDGWHLQTATGISADGRTIVGTGTLNGLPQAWVATIPEPKSIVLIAVAVTMLSFAGRKAYWRLGCRRLVRHRLVAE
jgi:probable HAF family extracellular repeat protein